VVELHHASRPTMFELQWHAAGTTSEKLPQQQLRARVWVLEHRAQPFVAPFCLHHVLYSCLEPVTLYPHWLHPSCLQCLFLVAPLELKPSGCPFYVLLCASFVCWACPDLPRPWRPTGSGHRINLQPQRLWTMNSNVCSHLTTNVQFKIACQFKSSCGPVPIWLQ
jgi:hypothetical protein